jgi:uncharacterized damage-inducible protein DinB
MTSTTQRTNPPSSGDEVTLLRGFLDFHRDTLRMKAEGLSTEQLSTTLPPSTLTIGGMVKHLALVEQSWFSGVFRGEEDTEPWASVDWDADPDWEFRTAAEDSPEELRDLLDRAVADSDRILEEALAEGLDALAVRRSKDGPVSLRWILLHMIEEYARHNGHADLIRESIDGQTGE